MANRTQQETLSIEIFEEKAQDLIHVMFELCEERIHATPRLKSPVGKTMAEAAMSVKYAIRAFIAIKHLQGK